MFNKNLFIDFLISSGVLRFGEFKTKSGRISPFFMNAGEFKTGAQLNELSNWYANLINQEFSGAVHNLFGPAYKGIPLSAATSTALYRNYQMDISFTYNRKEAKDHGEGGTLVGYKYEKPTNVVIIEDVTTAGTSVHETFELLKCYPHAKVIGLVVAVDRCEKSNGNTSALQEIRSVYGLRTASIVDINDIIAYLESSANTQQALVSPDILEKIYAYRNLYGVV
jgi:orotate phosphoribosyltransferase